MKKKLPTIFLIAILVIGLSLMLYPTIANKWNSYRQTRSVANYIEQVANLKIDTYDKLLSDAYEYNGFLTANDDKFEFTESQKAYYERTLNIDGNGVMGYIEIPEIDVLLPIYHGTGDSALQLGVGHLEWSSLPVGGKGTHCVISGHRGLPSARLFTDLDELVNGDLFTIYVLDERFTYEVDQIRIVEPHELNNLSVEADKDFCTLVTCTPYGINSHRMLVRGHRVENADDTDLVRVTADAMQIKPIVVAPFVAIPILLILFIILMIPKSKKDRRN